MPDGKHYIQQHGIDHSLTNIYNQLKTASFIPDIIIGVGRGGLIPATLLAYMLDVKTIYNYSVQSYNDNDQRESITVVQEPGSNCYQYVGKNILIVDDLSDSGNTLSFIKEKLVRDMPSSNIIKVATLFVKDKTSFVPDFYTTVYHHDTWLVFPWETT